MKHACLLQKGAWNHQLLTFLVHFLMATVWELFTINRKISIFCVKYQFICIYGDPSLHYHWKMSKTQCFKCPHSTVNWIYYFADDGETVIIAKPLQTMGPPFPIMEVGFILCCHLNFLLTGSLSQSFRRELKPVTESNNLNVVAASTPF